MKKLFITLLIACANLAAYGQQSEKTFMVEQEVIQGINYTIRTSNLAHSQQVLQSAFMGLIQVIRRDDRLIEEWEMLDLVVNPVEGAQELIDKAVLKAFTMEELEMNSEIKIYGQFAITPEGEIIHSRYFYDTTGTVRPEQVVSIDLALFSVLRFVATKPNLEEYSSLSAMIAIDLGEIYSRKHIGVYEGSEGAVLIPTDRGGIGRLNP